MIRPLTIPHHRALAAVTGRFLPVTLHATLALMVAACASTKSYSVRVAAARVADSVAAEAVRMEREQQLAAPQPRSIAVLPFRGETLPAELDPLRFALADLLVVDLSRVKSLQVIERLRVDAILRELALTGAKSDDGSPRVARLAGAERLVLGSVTMDQRVVDLRLRVVEPATGAVMRGAERRGAAGALLDAQKVMTLALLDSLGVTPTPAERAAIEARATTDLSALLAFGRGVRDELFADFTSARGHYRDALRRDPGFSAARQRLVELPVATGPLTDATLLVAAGISPAAIARLPDGVSPAFRQRVSVLLDLVVSIP
jgi:TolB-like protein